MVEGQVSWGFLSFFRVLTGFYEFHFFSSEGSGDLAVFDRVLLEVAQDEVVDHDAFGEFWNGEGVEAPVDWVPPLESMVGRYKHRVLFS